jgi:hypothetical protein
MTAKPPAHWLLLLVSLLSPSATETVSTFINPLSIPSCTCYPTTLKCPHEFQYAILGVASAAKTISLLLESISTAKYSCINVLLLLSRTAHIASDFSKSLYLAINIAIQELNLASKVSIGFNQLRCSFKHPLNC